MNAFELGNKIKALRKKEKLSQKQFAAQIGVSKLNVLLYELYIKKPGSNVLASISETFHVSTDYLLGLDKIKRVDLSGLHEEDIDVVNRLIDILRSKNQKRIR